MLVFVTEIVAIPEGAVLSFIQAGEAAVQSGDLTVGDWREDAEEFTEEMNRRQPHRRARQRFKLSTRPFYTSLDGCNINAYNDFRGCVFLHSQIKGLARSEK